MTREEAVKVLKRMIKTGIAYDDGYAFEPLTEDEEMACSMAIKALEQKPIHDKIRTDYENRLKADLVAILEEIDLEMSEQFFGIQTEPWEVVEKLRKEIIQQKINALKAESEGKE